MGISSDLQKLIVARLREAVPSVQGRVYDGPSETAQMPYVSIGLSYWIADDAECIEGRSEVVQIDIWASNKPNKVAAKDVTDEVAAALKGWASDAIAMHPLRVVLVRVMDDPAPGVVHGIVQIEAWVEG